MTHARLSRRLPLAAAGLLLALLSLAPRAAHAADVDLWYVVDLFGQRSGWSNTRVTTEGDRITTSSDMELSIRRGETVIKVTIGSEWVETAAGEPVSLRWEQGLGGPPVVTTYEFGGEKWTRTIEAPGMPPQTSDVTPPAGDWLPPAAEGRLIEQRLAAGAKEIVTRSLDVSQGVRIVETKRRVLGEEKVEALGRVVPGYRTMVTTDVLPGETEELIDRSGTPIRSEVDLGGIVMRTVLADRELALGDLDPPELMRKTFVTPDRPIPDPRRTRLATYILSVPDGELPDLPDTGWQRVERLSPSSARVVVNAIGEAAPAGDVDAETYLARSTMLDIQDPAVLALLDRAGVEADAPPAERAETLRAFVYGFIDAKTLGVGFGSASDVARSATGDCSEHAALLAALLRASGIPSRVASGLIYADSFAGSENIFGYHMWTQALLEIDGVRRWVDFDAVLPPGQAFDATHIAVAVSTLSDDEPDNAMVTLAPLLGRLEIRVESVGPPASRRAPLRTHQDREAEAVR